MGFVKGLLIVLGILLLLYLFLAAPRLDRRSLGALAGVDYAHRGLWSESVPENSLPAFRLAVENGYGIELDVHLTQDDALVVFHDDNVKRMCGVDRLISDMTLAQVRALRLKDTDCLIPTLDEVLETVDGKVPLIVEIKPDARLSELCAAACARLRAYAGPYCVESFHPMAVRWFRINAPEVIRGQLAYGCSDKRHSLMDIAISSLIGNVLGRPDFIAYEAATDRNLPMAYMRLCRPYLVAWTVRSQETMDQLRSRYDLQIFEGILPNR